MASMDFCTPLICAEVAAITSLKAASTAGSLLVTRAWVRAALVCVKPIHRLAASRRAPSSRLTVSPGFATWPCDTLKTHDQHQHGDDKSHRQPQLMRNAPLIQHPDLPTATCGRCCALSVVCSTAMGVFCHQGRFCLSLLLVIKLWG